MNKVIEFLKNIGHFAGRAMGFIKDHIPEQLLEQALKYVIEAEGRAIDNAAKRKWVLEELARIPGVKEHTARIVVELAVAEVKQRLAEATTKAINR